MTDAVFKAGFEDFFGIIIFLVVIGRIISSIKNSASGPKKPSAPPAPNVNPDLERLFKALTGQPLPEEVASKPPAPPPPPPVPVVKARPAAPVAAPVTATVPRRAQSLQSISRITTARNIRRPSQNWVNASLNLGGAGSPAGKSAATRAARAEVMQMLHNSNDIKKAVLLREILGPPVSMRT